MGTLSLAPSCFVYVDNKKDKGEELGLTLSTAPGAQALGKYTFFTSRTRRGQQVPDMNPFAVLPLFHEADPEASVALLDHWLAYEESAGTDSPDHFPAPAGRTYLPYQRAGIAYALRRPHTLFGDEPGLGKTVQAIGVCNATDARRILVVCPASVRLQWAAEMERWRVRRSGYDNWLYPILQSRDGFDRSAEVVITSYQLAQTAGLGAALRSVEWDVVIYDEAHYLKNYNAARTKRLLGTWDGGDRGIPARRILALTGTPLPNRPRECYTLARALDWDSISRMSEDEFNGRYNPTVVMPNGFRLEWTGHLLELQARLRTRFMVRRAKADVLKDLPEKVYELAYIDPDGEVKKALRAEKLLAIDPENLNTGDAELMGHISQVRRQMGVAKAPGVIAHVNMLLDGGAPKVVVFAYHTEVIRLLLEAYGPAAVCIQGATGAAAREHAKRRFQDDPECQVFIGQLTAAGTGVDGLQNVCSHAVFAEASWTPGENEQCVDRLHRIGQRSSVVAQFLVAPGSLDERILGSAIRKAGSINKALDQSLAA